MANFVKRLWHKFFGHPNVVDMKCATCGDLGGGDTDVDGSPPNPDANYYRYWRQ